MPLTDEEYAKLSQMGWIKPSTAMQLAQGAQLSQSPVGLGAPVTTPPVATTSLPVGGVVPSDPAPPGGWPAGQGLSHATPVIPGMVSPGQPGYKPPPTMEGLITQANVGTPPPKAPVAADLKKPTAPPGTLPGDGSDPGDSVSIPYMKRSGTPDAQTPPISGGGSVGSGAGRPGKPAGPGPITAGQEYLTGLTELQKRTDERGERLVTAFEDQALAEREKGVAVATGKLEALNKAETMMKESGARLQEARNQADEADRASRVRASEIANKKIDPDRYWNNKNTGEKIIGALALALGTFGSALAKTPNFAFQMMESAIDRDISAQRDGIANAKDSAAMLDKISKDKYGRSMNQYELEAHQRLDSYNYALQKVDAAASKYDDPIAKAKAEQFKVGLQDKIDNTKQGISTNIFEVKSAAEAAEARKRAAMAAAGVAGHKEQKEQIKEYRSLVQKNMENGDNLNVAQARALAVMGGPGAFKGNLPALSGKPEGGPQPLASDPMSLVPKNQATDALKEQAAVSNAEKSIENVNKLFEKWKAGSSGVGQALTGTQRDIVKASVKTTVKRGAGPGMSSDSDREQFIDPLVPALGDSDETLERKKAQIIDGLRGSAPSPILDRYKPGWRTLSEEEATAAGKTQFGFKPAGK